MKDLEYTELLRVYREIKKTECKKFYIFSGHKNGTTINENFKDTLRIMLDINEYDFEEKYNFKARTESQKEAAEAVKLLLEELKRQKAKEVYELYFTIDKKGSFVSKLQNEEDFFNKDVDAYFPDSVSVMYKDLKIRCMRREAELFNLKIVQ